MNNKWKWIVVILLVALLLASGAVVYAQARPVSPNVAPAYLNAGLPAGATARLECDGWIDVVAQDTSVIEVVCQPWVLAPGD